MDFQHIDDEPLLPWQLSQWGDVVSLIVPRLGHGVQGAVTLVVAEDEMRLLIAAPGGEYEFLLAPAFGADRERLLHPRTQVSLLQSEYNGRIYSCLSASVQQEICKAA